MDRVTTADSNLWVLRFKMGREDCWALWSADDQDRQVILQTESSAKPLMIRQTGHDAYLTQWGYRDWAAKGGELASNRLSMVVGHRPVLLGNDLAGVTVAEVIPGPQQAAETK